MSIELTHNSAMSEALEHAEEKSNTRPKWPPVNSGERGVMGLVDEELGYETNMRGVLD